MSVWKKSSSTTTAMCVPSTFLAQSTVILKLQLKHHDSITMDKPKDNQKKSKHCQQKQQISQLTKTSADDRNISELPLASKCLCAWRLGDFYISSPCRKVVLFGVLELSSTGKNWSRHCRQRIKYLAVCRQ